MTNDRDAVTEKNYRDHLKSLANLIIAEITKDDGDIANCIEECQEAAMNSRWTMMTFQAMSLLQWSKNQNAIFDDDCDPMAGAECMDEIYCRAARHAMVYDLMAVVEEMASE